MITDDEILYMICDLESDRIERKESFSDKEKVCQAICAFANDLPGNNLPGIVIIGATDDGKVTGIPVTDNLLQSLASIRDDGNIVPLPSLDVQKRTIKGQDIAVVCVHPSRTPPVRYKGIVWIRSGPRRGKANPDDERRLNEKRRSLDIPFDIMPVFAAGLGISSLDTELFQSVYLPSAISPDVLAENGRTLTDQLLSCRFTHRGDEGLYPTVLGILTIGKSPIDLIPSAYIQFLRIDGLQLGDPIKDEKRIQGPLTKLFDQLDSTIKTNIQVSPKIINQDREMSIPDYPLVAIQQVVRNAILHRTYESTHSPVRIYWFNDRIEVHNPGGPFGQVNTSNFGMPGISDYRNPNLAAAMRDLGYVQRFGVGIALTQRAMGENGNPAPEFQVTDQHIAVILRHR